jgi:hypothetical protein
MFAALLTFSACTNNSRQQVEKGNKKDTLSESSNLNDTISTANTSGPIALNTLPTAIREYVTKNHPGYNMKNAAHDPLCQGGDAIDVAISKKGSPTYSLIFKPDGTFVQLEEDIDINKAPAKILKEVKIKYAGYQPASQIEKLTLADKSIQYLLDITKNGVSKEVIFNTDGSVACEN